MMRLDFSRRADLTERMDEPDCCETTLFRTLDQFRLVNRAFSRYTTLLNRYVVQEMRKAPDREYCLMDLGAGGCDIARWLTRQARRYALHLRVLAVDGNPRVAWYARQANRKYPEIEMRMMDALDVPFHEPVDFVFANHFLHHLTDVQVVNLVKRLDGAGVQCYILSDIARSRFAWYGFRLAATPFAHRSFIVTDGLTSILRSFTVEELRRLLREAALHNPVQVLSMFPSRLALVGRHTPMPSTRVDDMSIRGRRKHC